MEMVLSPRETEGIDFSWFLSHSGISQFGAMLLQSHEIDFVAYPTWK